MCANAKHHTSHHHTIHLTPGDLSSLKDMKDLTTLTLRGCEKITGTLFWGPREGGRWVLSAYSEEGDEACGEGGGRNRGVEGAAEYGRGGLPRGACVRSPSIRHTTPH